MCAKLESILPKSILEQSLQNIGIQSSQCLMLFDFFRIQELKGNSNFTLFDNDLHLAIIDIAHPHLEKLCLNRIFSQPPALVPCWQNITNTEIQDTTNKIEGKLN